MGPLNVTFHVFFLYIFSMFQTLFWKWGVQHLASIKLPLFVFVVHIMKGF
jgi:hypothetical protein